MRIKHLNYAMELCEIQRRNGLYFLFEHPANATSWNTTVVQRLMKNKDVNVYSGDLCCYDLKQMFKGEELYVKKANQIHDQ